MPTAKKAPERLTPPVPPLFRPPTNKSHRRNRPRRTQLALLEQAAEELRESTRYDADFGSYAPEREKFAAALEEANRWNRELRAGQRWLLYVEDEEARAWSRVLGFLTAFSPAFLLAAKHAGVSQRYGALKQMILVRRKPRKKKPKKTP